ncbi:exosome complex component RRP41-like [Uloborus diversus]|uniref:exosome complex component RRP41-like n=1 Tax=Uloborus diversus TaxID=327109 RepID=UPI00240A87EA|nr:exosome complex component RRP41-like [Uloborus diversus]
MSRTERIKRMELLSDLGIRMDGRRPNEVRKIACKMGVSDGADGSAYFVQGNSQVLVTVYGPHEVTGRSRPLSDKAVINCQYRIAPFSGRARKAISHSDRKLQEQTVILRQAFEAAILTNLFPKSQIDISFLVLYQDGGICSTCINAGTLALINAAIPMKDYLCACSVGFVKETPLMDATHFESLFGRTELNLAILSKSEEIVCDEITARLHKDHMKKIRRLAIKGCKDMHAVLDSAVRKHVAQTRHS